MPYTKEHREASRMRIVESARRLFNRRGFEKVSIDDIMENAGMTRGGFYHHFRNKNELFVEVVASFADHNPWRPRLRDLDEDRDRARALVDLYLCDQVLEKDELQCPLYALPGDAGRGGRQSQQAYSMLIRTLAQVFLRALDGDDREQRAHAIVSLCVGGMVLARTTEDGQLARSVRAGARQQALALLAG